jgi:hypothetical protein
VCINSTHYSVSRLLTIEPPSHDKGGYRFITWVIAVSIYTLPDYPYSLTDKHKLSLLNHPYSKLYSSQSSINSVPVRFRSAYSTASTATGSLCIWCQRLPVVAGRLGHRTRVRAPCFGLGLARQDLVAHHVVPECGGIVYLTASLLSLLVSGTTCIVSSA